MVDFPRSESPFSRGWFLGAMLVFGVVNLIIQVIYIFGTNPPGFQSPVWFKTGIIIICGSNHTYILCKQTNPKFTSKIRKVSPGMSCFFLFSFPKLPRWIGRVFFSKLVKRFQFVCTEYMMHKQWPGDRSGYLLYIGDDSYYTTRLYYIQ